jgi:hypothetical protein
MARHGIGAAAGEEQRVAIGPRARDVARADGAAGAGAVLDDEGAAEDALQLLRDDPRDGVRGPAWREGNDNGDRPRAGIGRLRRAGARRRQQAERAEPEAAPTAPVPS